GEVMVYIVAILMAPNIGAFAGGVGSAISDAILAPQYAPGTLVIKGLEGLIVGYLANLPLANLTKRKWLAVSFVLGAILASSIAYLGTNYLSGDQTLYLGFSSSPTTPIGPQFSFSFFVPWAFWVVLGAVTLVAVVVGGYFVDAKLGWTILAVLIGGSEMVLGYFLFESIGLQLGYVTAAVEVPINLGQVLVGLVVAIPVVRSYRRMVRRGPRLERTAGSS
ncbi:MAG: ECF transporter S component, partial [Thaumarchaeota archaeon]|nr:ECF transporter S component [Nitrososphaerota archaeon]